MFEDIDIKAIKKELRNFSKNYIENFNKIEKFVKSEIDEILTLKKKNKSQILCLTAYSKNFAEEVDKYADITLVGDSLGSVLYNYETTKKVTLTNMIDHARSVRIGVKKSLLTVDMPYNTYRSNSAALKNAKKILKETKCDAVKLEGGKKIISQVQCLIKNKIPVMGHLGLLPQTAKGKFRSKGKTEKEKKKLIKVFQMRFRPELVDGKLDLECYKIAKSLVNLK